MRPVITAAPVIVPAGAASVVALIPSPNRVGIIFTGSSVGVVTYSLRDPAVLNQVLMVNGAQGKMVLTLREHGEIVQRLWTVISSAGGTTLELYELYCSDIGSYWGS